jgi:hypothetical protein
MIANTLDTIDGFRDKWPFAERFKRLLPDAEGPKMVTGRHFLQEDSGPEIARLIAGFLDRQGGV